MRFFFSESFEIVRMVICLWHTPSRAISCSFVAVQARPGMPLQFYSYASRSCFILAPPRLISPQFCSRPGPSQHPAAALQLCLPFLASLRHRRDQSRCSFLAVLALPGIPLQFYNYAHLSRLISSPSRAFSLEFCSRPSPARHPAAVL